MNTQTVDEAIATLDAMIGQTRVQGRCTTCRKSLRYSCTCDGEPGETTAAVNPDLMAGYHYPNM